MDRDGDPKIFLILIVQTISIVLLWMMINVLIGIYFELGFFEGSPSWKNIMYYICFLTSLFFLIRHIKKKWNL